MSYFDLLTDNSFKKAPDGKIIYYPNGRFFKGYIVPDEYKYGIIRKSLNKSYLIMLITITIGSAFDWIIVWGLAPFLFIVNHIMARSRKNGMEISDLEYSKGEKI